MATATRTDASASDVLRALLDAGMPTVDSARMVAAQSALETAGWVGGLWNYNLGNITTNGPDSVTLPGNGLRFAAYPSLLAGAQALVRYLNAHGVLGYAVDGNLSGYVQRLRAIGYAGNANYSTYESGMQTWLARLQSVLPAPPWGKMGAMLVGAGLVGGAWLATRRRLFHVKL